MFFLFHLVSCLLKVLVICNNDSKINIIFLVSHSCYRNHTEFNHHPRAEYKHLEQLHVDCGLNKVIQSFNLVRDQSHTKIRYDYTCCKIPCPCHQRIEATPFTDYKNWRIASLYEQDVQCTNDDFITDFRLIYRASQKQIGYKYKCCNTSDRNKAIYHAKTRSNDNGNGKVYYLDRHHISCQNGYGLTKFHLIKNSHTKYQYNFSCTKILTTCAEQGKKHL